jgi:membrane protease YdiL (CAAX protease family)
VRHSSRFAWLLLGILGLSIFTAPLLKAGVDWLLHARPGISPLLGLDRTAGFYDFGRVYRRLVLVLTLLLGYLARGWFRPIPLRGMQSADRPARELGSGWSLGSLTFAFFLANLLLLGERSIAPHAPPDWPWRLGRALVTGLLVGTLEETIFRGFLLGGLLADRSRHTAVLLSSALFSAVHFFSAPVLVGPGINFGLGLHALLAHLRPLTNPVTLRPFLGLFLLGIVLAYAYLWSHSLPFTIGLHAGWVFLAKIEGFLLQGRSGIDWLYGQEGLLAGPLGWILLLLILPVLRLWLLYRPTTQHR